MRILGIGGFDHDGSACVVEHGRVIVALELERVTRDKHRGFDAPETLERMLDRLEIDRVDAISLADRAWVRARSAWLLPLLHARFPGIVPSQHDHHECHLACGFACSPFERATVVSLDGKGEERSATAGLATREQGLEVHVEVASAHSLGRLWWAASEFAGLPGHHAAGKTMALAAWGQPRWLEAMLAHWVPAPAGGFRFDPRDEHPDLFRQVPRLVDWMAKLAATEPAPRGAPRQPHCDLAASLQCLTELVVESFVTSAVARTGERRVCMAGGVALNGLANHRLVASRSVDALFVPPCPDDRGLSLGAAALAAWQLGQPIVASPRFGAFLGPPPELGQLRAGARPIAWPTEVARRIAAGQIIGCFQGRDEFGPRALGHRSILASPVSAEMRERLNRDIKRREPFRPFGASVLREQASTWFECDEESPYMLRIVPVRAERRAVIPAVVHRDGTSRLHTVSSSDEPRLAAVLSELGALGHPPLVLDTSFNGPGEPIVHTVTQARECAASLDLDALVVEDMLLEREALRG